MFGRIHQGSHQVQGFSLLGDFITDSISLLVIGLFRFSVCVLVLVAFMFLRIYLFHLVIQFVGIQLVIVLSYNSFIFVESAVMSSLTFLDIVISLYFLVHLAKCLMIWLIFSKNQVLVSLMFFIFFLFGISLFSSLIFISFPLLTLGLVNSFSSSLSCKVRWLVEVFLFCFVFVFSARIIDINSSFSTAFAASY
uniref:Uncharacterized protein n=1 Tax=Rousettus aegyptiacus TaxID=9407 RepID=A0A7J8E937_ROUAE|nr:hypothetical protein HJG63_008175 [Rousettus aegyptiacus]